LFATTNWSLVVAAGEAGQPEARKALATLCELYWYPVYALVRHFGNTAERAEDLTQGFFLDLLERRSIQAAERDRGRFRSFLKVMVRHYLANEHTRQKARKRGGDTQLLSMDFAEAEARYESEKRTEDDPERTFERRWARTVLSRGLERLRAELQDSPDAARWTRLEHLLTGDPSAGRYQEVADELGLSLSGVKMAVRRLRKRYGQALRDEVAHTVADPQCVDDEVRYLLSVVLS
jgi:RNA polymerase sigma-70 factor (ECF subfamily)